ncbi:hypothetical protein SAMN05444679_102127 [Variovorax sp. CF079]|uniref:esterase/lipase family protein n=1 Tax=Variovorax sp. CF079 TaxID=1882774 RepID=UPI000886939D|nr:hypothetical protein [Variovorax sp. CF079]SDC27764.1 hypothetical protein SAMN05444679_102127 [Variovorax sp. CF079]
MSISLDGSARSVSLGPGYALRTPGWRGTAEVHAGGATTTRSAMRGLDGGLDALEAALRETQVTETRQIDLTLQPAHGTLAAGTLRSAQGAAEIELDVPDAGPDHGQLMLSIDDAGALRWHLPVGAGTAAPVSRGAGGTTRFRIPAAAAPAPSGAPASAPQRSLFGVLGRKLLKVLVYPLTDGVTGAAVDFIAKHWEERKRPYRLRRFSPQDYQVSEATIPSASDLSAMAAQGPVLLFVHGTFSTAHGGFGQLPPATMAELDRRYGSRVIAFDHPTLSDDPRTNVEWLLSRLPASGMEVDIVCHSRGGLVARVLAEAPASFGLSAGHIKVRRIVLAAVPNNGTLLADPDHMVNMVDRLTTALALFPSGPVTETLEALITVIKVLGHGGLKGLDGLASMCPTGRFLDALNGGGGQPGDYFAIASNYEPTDAGLRGLVSGAADSVLDQVFGDAGNDLVVPTDGVYQKNGNARFPLPSQRVLLFNEPQGVIHTQVFQQTSVSEKLLNWLS